jgi:hypothetical protein
VSENDGIFTFLVRRLNQKRPNAHGMRNEM